MGVRRDRHPYGPLVSPVRPRACPGLAITRRTVTGLADRLPTVAPDLPGHPDYPRILAAFNHATRPLRAKDVCEAFGHELLPKSVEGTRAKLKRLVKLGILTEADTGNFARK
ncbi:conserved hypothetical protein [Streptomyces scabiei 87.22]|uniref:Uncharacterized protein n=1 Tax=Streptomyces scabiei (strain 87.22) TaxID=680198 RepID=C9ZCW2_STRSW|nr:MULTISPECIES: hypothetical protein [Streptomyces]MDW8478276.1 hypothetical protein [Streptomyces scabiei]MDX2538488.1 hypothetical protein [Streptomyces scabiei]MDX2565760.1 hypothetical protein [Streptomyces scabiei]MDX2577001.1 hypothetical protein [Streptomyces scabiei]MDX2630184.1 hypothetical protein [Streptomyces scabiei]